MIFNSSRNSATESVTIVMKWLLLFVTSLDLENVTAHWLSWLKRCLVFLDSDISSDLSFFCDQKKECHNDSMSQIMCWERSVKKAMVVTNMSSAF